MIKAEECIHIEDLNVGTISFRKVMIYNRGDTSYNDTISSLLPNRGYTPVKGDKIFFVSGCNVPRFKVKKFCQNYEVSLVKYIEKANVKFIGPGSIKMMLEPVYTRVYTKVEFLNHLDFYTKGQEVMYFALRSAIANSEGDYVTTTYAVMTNSKSNPLTYTGNISECPIRVDLSKFDSPEIYNKFISIMSDPQLYPQEEIVKRINTGGVMGKEEYISIQRLLKSTDGENVKLAMETMANSDYEKSCVYLLLLLRDFSNEINSSSSRNHVNFKSLLKFFEIESLSNINLNSIIQTLLKRKLLNMSNLDLIMPIALENLIHDSDEETKQYFQIKELEVTDIVRKGIQDNILDKQYDTLVIDSDEELEPKIE